MNRVRTRFAPSPTGSLHLGNARTAVLNWLIARHHGGDFVLRIEDTDTERNVAGAESDLLVDLEWLGLSWDEGPGAGGGERGAHGPYHQSRRLELYRQRATELLDTGAAYRCFCSADQLQAERDEALARGESPRYSGRCRSLDSTEVSERLERDMPHVIRLATPDEGPIVIDDVIRGRVTFQAAGIGDFVLVRSDGIPTYNFAVVVDDAAMEITHVVRGAGHLSNTPHQILVYRGLGLEPPVFAHAPTVLGPDRKKLSKRTGARPLRQLREEGLHPDAVLNYLSLLGWSSPSGEEVLERTRLVAEVTLDRMNAGDVVFDPDKLYWLSARHIEAMPLDALEEAVRPYVVGTRFESLLDDRFPAVLSAVRTHLRAFGEITDNLQPFLGPETVPVLSEEAGRVAGAVRAALAALGSWDERSIHAALKEAGNEVGARGRSLYAPVRLATTGEEHGPPLAAVLTVQGRDAVLRELEATLARADGGV